MAYQNFAIMKNVLFSMAMVTLLASMTACGGQGAKGDDRDSTAVADSAVAVAPAELWTTEAVEAQVREMYDRLNDMDKRGIVNIHQLEAEFCSSYYLGLRDAISKALTEAMGDDRLFMGDEEGYRFFAGMSAPLEVETVEAELLTGDMAQAQVRFKGADKKKGFVRLELDLENGRWRVKNFDQPGVFGPGGYLKIMEDFAGEHGISYEGIPSPKGDDAMVEWDVSVRTTDLETEKPRYEAMIRDVQGKTIQVAEGHTVDYPQEMLKPFGNVWQADVNFDGHTDVMICLGMMPTSDQAITYYDAWLYNPQTGKFDFHEGFRDISNPEVDIVNQYVTSHYLIRDGVTQQYTAWSIQKDGTQKKLKEWGVKN
jgi:hypothetical protein